MQWRGLVDTLPHTINRPMAKRGLTRTTYSSCDAMETSITRAVFVPNTFHVNLLRRKQMTAEWGTVYKATGLGSSKELSEKYAVKSGGTVLD